ncbi:unnamed protein product [Rhodiola kirilowii]
MNDGARRIWLRLRITWFDWDQERISPLPALLAVKVKSNRFVSMDRLVSKIEPSFYRRSRQGPVSFVKHFKYKVIKQATDDFRRVLYSNAHGTAYRAVLCGGSFALVKDIRECDQDAEVFYREVQLIGRLHHRHILLLIGFSTEQKRLLIFDNAENGSLKDHFNDPCKTPLNWRTRLQIAVGVAAALEYLLVFNDPPISHISVTSSNIMLDENFNAKLSDIGVLNPGNKADHPTSTASCSKDCMGQECGNIIFQLGVLILELVTGQASENGGADLIHWIQEPRLNFSLTIDRMIDPDLGNTYDDRELKNLLAVAKMCIKSAKKPSFPVNQLFRYLQKKSGFPQVQ